VVSRAQQEALDYYGSSLVGLNVSLNGDLNLRCFEIMAAGGALLTDRLSPESGWESLWQEGRELSTYGTPEEMVERARQLLARPAEARALGEAAAAWFDAHFNEKRRRAAFASLVCDGRAPTEFAEKGPSRPVFSSSRHPEQTRTALQVYEEIQEVHGQQESLRIVFDPGVPANFERLFRTLPRVEIARLGTAGSDTVESPADLAVVGHSTAKGGGFGTPARVWIWDGAPGAAFPSGPAAPGYQKLPGTPALFVRCGLPGPKRLEISVARARSYLQSGDIQNALDAAKKGMAENPASAEPYLIIGELAQDSARRKPRESETVEGAI
jgi:hypothetical protein